MPGKNYKELPDGTMVVYPSEAQKKAAKSMGTKDYSTANVDLKKGKGLPIADMSRSIEARGSGNKIRYYQDGREVRLPKNNG
jgi:hypothetical protein